MPNRTKVTESPLSCFQSIEADFTDLDCPPHNSGSHYMPNRTKVTESPLSCLQSIGVDFIDRDCPLHNSGSHHMPNRTKVTDSPFSCLQSIIRDFINRDCPPHNELLPVIIDEITYNLLRASKMSFSHLSSERRFMTARVVKRAVVIDESSFKLLLA